MEKQNQPKLPSQTPGKSRQGNPDKNESQENDKDLRKNGTSGQDQRKNNQNTTSGNSSGNTTTPTSADQKQRRNNSSSEQELQPSKRGQEKQPREQDDLDEERGSTHSTKSRPQSK